MSEIISPYNPKIKTVNIKEDFPPCDVAVFNLYKAIFENERMGFEVLKIVHGYGSHGKGGEIKKAVKDNLSYGDCNYLLLYYLFIHFRMFFVYAINFSTGWFSVFII